MISRELSIVPRDREIPAGIDVSELLRMLVRHPWQHLGRRWNYKSAVTSSLFRGLLFFATNVTAGLPAAVAALSTEFWFRFLTAGYYGALTQAFRRVEPARTAMIAAMIVLPIVGHGLEFLVHWLSGTPNLSASVGLSIVFTAFSTSFNLFAMRRGAMIIGDGSGSLLQDLRRMPALLGAYGMSILAPLSRAPRRRGGPSGPPWAGLTASAKASASLAEALERRPKTRPYGTCPQVGASEAKPEGVRG